jgi:hypothetical protein
LCNITTIDAMIPQNKVHPSEEVIPAKSLELGPCILITPRTLDLGQQIQEKQLDAPEVVALYSDIDKKELNEITDDEEVAHKNIKIQSPVLPEDKVNVNYSYTLHSPNEAPSDITKHVVATKNAHVVEQVPPSQHKLLSFSPSVKPVVLPSLDDKNWRRKSVVSKDLSTGRKNRDDTNTGL